MKITLRALISTFCSISCATFVHAQDISYAQAHDIANAFFSEYGLTAQKTAAKIAPFAKEAENSPYYIFNDTDNTAFAVVSGDSRLRPILAYSTETAFDNDAISDGAQYMLDIYGQYIMAIQDQDADAATDQTDLGLGEGKVIQTARWNQSGAFWDQYCPTIDGVKSPAGCVATAMAIIMRHHQWPDRGFGSKSYTTSKHALELSADFSSQSYDWEKMPMGTETSEDWTEEGKDMVAKLMYHCGIATSMDYDSTGSGTTNIHQSQALYRYFGYTYGQFIPINDVEYSQFVRMLADEIDSGYPLLYRGTSTSGGHAYICDGYNSEGMLHFNFGWSGKNNGFWSVIPDTEHKYPFLANQEATFGLRPDYDAATRPLSDVQMVVNHLYDPIGMEVSNGIIKPDQTFTIVCNYTLNISDAPLTFKFGAFLCPEDGSSRILIGESQQETLPEINYYTTYTIACSLPQGYTPAYGDKIALCTSEDNGNTWQDVNCYYADKQTVDLMSAYRPLVTFSNPLATYCPAYNVDFTDATNIYAYKAVENNNESIILERVHKVRAGEGVLLRGMASDGTHEEYLPAIPEADMLENNLMVGVTHNITLTQSDPSCTVYALGALNGEIGFYPANGVSLKAGQAYLSIPNSPMGAPRKIDIQFSESGASSIVCDKDAHMQIYNAQGIKVSNPTSGLYIINGKKTILK